MTSNKWQRTPWRGIAAGIVLAFALVGAAVPSRAADNQVFITYEAPHARWTHQRDDLALGGGEGGATKRPHLLGTPAEGFSLKVPEGWSRRSVADGVSAAIEVPQRLASDVSFTSDR